MSVLVAEIIKKKRDGQSLNASEIQSLVTGYTQGSIPDYQMSAWLMASLLKGLNADETHHLTQAMLHSGVVVDFGSLKQTKVDKHSTGGVGDKTSFILAPIVAAAGIAVPMISGRGLGHTGGTLDKLESIPGLSTQLNLETFKRYVEKYNLCYIGQTKEICPADKKLYALRDVTATVESIPLICASIMSKKLAEGIDGLVLDVKFGSGAFMKNLQDAESLARALKRIGENGGKKVAALLTNMEEPLGRFIGNALEIEESVQILSNHPASARYQDTIDLSLDLAGAMIWIGGARADFESGRELAASILKSGQAMAVFEKVISAQGGDLKKLPRAQYKKDFKAMASGFLSRYNTEKVGIAALVMGAGRRVFSDSIDPVAGIEIHKKVGDSVQSNEVLFTLYARDESLFEASEQILTNAFEVSPIKPTAIPLVAKKLFEREKV